MHVVMEEVCGQIIMSQVMKGKVKIIVKKITRSARETRREKNRICYMAQLP